MAIIRGERRFTVFGPAYERDKCLARAAELEARSKTITNPYAAMKALEWANRELEEACQWDADI